MNTTRELSVKKENENAVGNYIKIVRIRRGMSQKNFSQLTGISNEQICRIEHGVIRPSITYLKRIAGCLAEPFDRLLELSGYMGGLTEVFKYTSNNGKEEIYMDTSGNSINITEVGLKIYSKNPELLTLLNEDIEKLSKEDIELFILFMKARRKEDDSNGEVNNEVKKVFCSLKTFLNNFLKCTLSKQLD